MAASHWSLLIGGLLLGACGSDRQREGRSSDTMNMGHMDSAGMPMGGMDMASMRRMPAMRAHMDSMMQMGPEQMQAMMSRHEAMMSQMLDRMGSDMRKMNMSASSEWTALTDSVKQDLAELPSVKGARLSARMKAHADRVRRLIAMHEAMMK
jgi:hypothetical protein